MSNPIGETGSTPTTTSPPTTTGTDPVDSGGSVSSGFSTENSVSQTEGNATGVSQGSTSLDSPEETTTSSTSFLQQAFKARLEGFRSVFSNFNAQFSSGQIDLSDTQTLLLVFRGMISDIKALNSAENIDSVSSERQFLQAQRSEISKAQIEIDKSQAVIDAKNLELQGKQSSLQAKQAILTSKSAELSTAQSANPVDTNLVNSLTAEVSQLQSEVSALQAEISALSGEVATLESQNQARRVQVAVRQALLALTESAEFVTRAFAIAPVKSEDEEDLETGEEKLDALERELQELDALLSREELQVKLAKQILSDFNREVVREFDRYSENIQPQGIAAELKALLSPQVVSNLFSLFSAQDASALASVANQAAPSDQQLADAAEGLALILLAEPSVTASEENPVDQPYLGDSLSLEGANNPQAFALLLLKERMADIQEALGKNADGVVVDSVGTNQFAQLLEAEREVDAMVVEAIKDQELSEAAIMKAKKF